MQFSELISKIRKRVDMPRDSGFFGDFIVVAKRSETLALFRFFDAITSVTRDLFGIPVEN